MNRLREFCDTEQPFFYFNYCFWSGANVGPIGDGGGAAVGWPLAVFPL